MRTLAIATVCLMACSGGSGGGKEDCEAIAENIRKAAVQRFGPGAERGICTSGHEEFKAECDHLSRCNAEN